MSGQSCATAEGGQGKPRTMEALHTDSGRASQDPYQAPPPDTSLHEIAQPHPNRIHDPLCSIGIYPEYHHGPPPTSRHVYAHLPRPLHLPHPLPILSICPHHRHPRSTSQLQRVSIILIVSIASITWVDTFKRYCPGRGGGDGGTRFAMGTMPASLLGSWDLSVCWLLIQYCLIGIAEVFATVGLLEFLYKGAPDAVKSIGSADSALAEGLGCFDTLLLYTIVKFITPSWLLQNINTGRSDYFYCLLTVMSMTNFGVFLYCTKRSTTEGNENSTENKISAAI